MKRIKRITALVLTILIAMSGIIDVLAEGVNDYDLEYEQYNRWLEASVNAAASGEVLEEVLMLGRTTAANTQLLQYTGSEYKKTNVSISASGTAVVVLGVLAGSQNLYQIRYNGETYYVMQQHVSLISEVPACTCRNETSPLKSHADTCDRKMYFHQIADLFTADELASVWDGFKADEKEHTLEYLSWMHQDKLAELEGKLSTTVVAEIDGAKITVTGGKKVMVTGNAAIPEDAQGLFEEGHWQISLDIEAEDDPEGVRIEISGLTLSEGTEARVYHFFDREEEYNDAEKRGVAVYDYGSAYFEILPAYVDTSNGTVSFMAYTFSTFTMDFLNTSLYASLNEPVVWVYRNGASEPYGKFATLNETVTNTIAAGGKTGLQNGDLIEFHGDTEETQKSIITRDVTIVSDGDHSAVWKSLPSSVVDCVAVNANKTVQICGSTSGTLTLDGNSTGHVINNKGILYINSNTVVRNGYQQDGGGIYNNGTGTLNVNGGVISGNTAIGNGGGIFNSSTSKVEITSGLICDNYAQSGGGIANNGELVISAGTISNNEATANAGGVLNNAAGKMTITGGVITKNKAKNAAGLMSAGKSANNGYLVMTGGSIVENVANDLGGGMYIGQTAVATISGSVEIKKNSVINGSGGGIVIRTKNANVTISGGTISENTANNGAGVCIEFSSVAADKSTLTMTGGLISDNVAAVDGGGVSISQYNEMTLSGTAIIKDNSANEHGGGIYISNQAQLNITGGAISDNTATKNGGAVNCGGGIVILTGGSISGNKAELGEGIYQNGTMNLSGAPLINNSDNVYLPKNRVITKIGDINGEILIPVVLEDETLTRDILISNSNAAGSENGQVVASDLNKLNVKILNELLRAIYSENGLDVASTTPKDVIELGYALADLVVKKTGLIDGDSAIFDVVVDGRAYHVVLNANNGGKVTIKDVPIESDYSINEQSGWSWRYTTTVPSNATGTITPDGVTVIFENSYSNDNWLSDEAYVLNEFDAATVPGDE